MSGTYAIGKGGMAACACLALAMCVISYIIYPVISYGGAPGICLAAPSEWGIHPLLSWLLNTIIIGGISLGGFLLNNKYNFIHSTQPVLPAVFMLLAASNPWINESLSASVIMCAVNLGCLSILFSAYNSQNATHEMFVIATFIGLGSMFQYAFIPMVIPFILGANAMKILRIKEVVAFLLGLVAPYWVATGLGIVAPELYHMPEVSPIFGDYSRVADLFLLMLDLGIFSLIGIFTGISTGIRLYAGNAFVSAIHFTICMMGLTCVVFLVVDFNNMAAYIATLYFTVAVQLAQACALWKMRHEWIVTAGVALIGIAFFIATIEW